MLHMWLFKKKVKKGEQYTNFTCFRCYQT